MNTTFFVSTTIILAIICLVCIIICISRKNRIERLLPSKLGSTFRCEGKDFIFVPFDAELYSSHSNEPISLFDVINNFWNDPARELNTFYREGHPFGISVEISSIITLDSGKYAFIIKDNYDNEYLLKTKYLPSSFVVDIDQFDK